MHCRASDCPAAIDTKTLQVTAKVEAAGPIAGALVAGMVQAPR